MKPRQRSWRPSPGGFCRGSLWEKAARHRPELATGLGASDPLFLLIEKDFYEALVGARVADFTVVPPGETSCIRFGDSEALLEARFLTRCLALPAIR